MGDSLRYFRNIFIIVFLLTAFSVAFFEKQFVPYLAIQKYDKEFFGFEVNFSPRWVPFFPFASMPMYSEKFDPGFVTDIELIGVNINDQDVYLNITKLFYPAWPEAFREVLTNQIYHGMSHQEFLAHVFLLYMKRRLNHSPQDYIYLKKLKLKAVTWDLDKWLEMRKSMPDIHNWYDWRFTDFKPNEENLLAEVTRSEALSYAFK